MGKRPRSGVPVSVPNAHASARGPKMAAHLLALTADGGVPLLTRKTGELKTLPFAIAGTLNGIHMFTRLRGADLLASTTIGEKILWRVYHNSVVLILITSDDNASDSHLAHVLDNIFGAMVMLVGIDNLRDIRNPEALKRELKICYGLIDHLLLQLDQDTSTIGDLIGVVDCIVCKESQSLQSYLDVFTDSASSDYGCLLVKGKVVVATKKWWTLSGQEMALISTFINSSPNTSAKDVPIYLPFSCPNVCNRLLIFQLIQGVEVCVLCGPSPTLAELQDEVPKFWKGAYELLKSVSSLHPRNFPANITLDRNILAFLLVHQQHNRCLFSVQPLEDDGVRLKEGKCVSLRRRQEIMRSLYKIVIGTYFSSTSTDESAQMENAATPKSYGQHLAQELYICTDHHKCYIIQDSPHQLFLLFMPSIPTFAMRSVAHKTLKELTRQKLYHL